MIILVPLGGMGERFKKNGYQKPKPLINVMGKPIINWLFDNLNLNDVDLVVIPYNKELAKYNFEDLMRKNYPSINFLFQKMDIQTRGAAETILLSIKQIELDDSPILCLDGDNFYLEDIVSQWRGNNTVFYFNDDSDSQAYSFLDVTNDQVDGIYEKNRISDKASTGAYGFQSFHTLKSYCQKIIDENIKQKNEYYLSGAIQSMLQDQIVFFANCIKRNNYVCLGTPLDVRLFCNNYPRINAFNGENLIKSQRYCFDLDNTLVTYPRKKNDYTTVEPINKNIELLRYLKKLGHCIIIYTARRMKTHQGNTGKIMADVGKITLDTLEKFQIPYDELYFGKPYADYYIDDLAISPYNDLEKELGYYKSVIDTRSFNNISDSVIHTFKKKGKDLSGEIFWYQNMPNTLKDMFPIYYGSDDNSYTMEIIQGIPFSRLFLSGEMSTEHLKHIMNSINRIHETVLDDTYSKNINIYQNYCEKIKNRYQNYDYSRFTDSEKIYQILLNKLSVYQEKHMGQMTVVHGDPVLTNIMINRFGKIKFIDMRGKLGDVLTLYGDSNYDWAKLYQSLIGYDEILDSNFISASYKSQLINYFEKRYTDKFGENQLEYLKYITASLLFTLIPLHDNDKCLSYYNLIYQLININGN